MLADEEMMEGGGGGGGGGTYTPPPGPTGYYVGPTYYDSRAKVVTLGDSYSSGTGIWRSGYTYSEMYGGYQTSNLYLTGRSDNECWREFNNTPGPRRAAAKGAKSIFVACKGAEIPHIYNQLELLKSQWPSDTAAGWANAEFIMTVGGNDLRTYRGEDWPELIQRCIINIGNLLLTAGFVGCHRNSENHIANFATIESNLTKLYTHIANMAPNAKVAVVAYPRIATPSKDWLGIYHCPDLTGVNGNEAKWFDQQVDELNNRISRAVAAVKAARPDFNIRYVPVNNYFHYGSCYGARSYADINDRQTSYDKTSAGLFGLYTSDASFHPTLKGYGAFYDALRCNLDGACGGGGGGYVGDTTGDYETLQQVEMQY